MLHPRRGKSALDNLYQGTKKGALTNQKTFQEKKTGGTNCGVLHPRREKSALDNLYQGTKKGALTNQKTFQEKKRVALIAVRVLMKGGDEFESAPKRFI